MGGTNIFFLIVNQLNVLLLHRDIKLEDVNFRDKETVSKLMSASKPLFEEKTRPSVMVAHQVGNMYTPSLYGALASFISW